MTEFTWQSMIEKLKKYIYAFTLLGWLIGGLYFGVAGYSLLQIKEISRFAELEAAKASNEDTSEWVNGEGLSFKNKYYLEAFRQTMKLNSIFPGFERYPDPLAFLLTACAFGILGAFTRIVKFIALDKVPIVETNVMATPLLGGMTGFIMLGLASIVPHVLISGEGSIKPISIVFLCFFAGLYSKRFFGWLSNNIGKLFGGSEHDKVPKKV